VLTAIDDAALKARPKWPSNLCGVYASVGREVKSSPRRRKEPYPR
jgi:hypothetical protein